MERQQNSKRQQIGRVLKALGRQFVPNMGTLLLVALLLWAQQAGAFSQPQGIAPNALPETITYQGKLTNAAGSPVTGNVEMVLALYSVPTEGTALWSETYDGVNAVPVQGGEFVVHLGSINPLSTDLWENDALYLGITVAGDAEMTPREKLAMVPYAMVAGTSLDVPPVIEHSFEATQLKAHRVDEAAGIRLEGDSSYNQWGQAASIHMKDTYHSPAHSYQILFMQDGRLYLQHYDGTQWLWNAVFYGPSGDLAVRGSVSQGALIERNLMRPEEQQAERIRRFSRGDLLCWDTTSSLLEKCNSLVSPLIIAVADANGKPIVLGAEPVKVLGPVQSGDLLVASDVPGYAVAWSQVGAGSPPTGIVIAKALEGFTGKQGMVKAMILGR